MQSRRLAERFEVVDVSEEQLRLARAALPQASFLHADLRELDFEPASFDAVTALYSFMHVPRDEHPLLLRRILRWLKPGGLFLASLSTVGGPDRFEEWLGVRTFFSGWDAATNSRLVREAGFECLVDEVVGVRQPHGEITFLWVLARAPS